ncbi:MAG: biotin transporter BioY [Anaerolineales bacterium]|nr:biotin transporter BioY [Anaerolineales bacterium]
MNYTDIHHPVKSVSKKANQIALILSASWLIAISAQFSINLPFSPVPITGQTLVVLLIGALLGKNRGTAAVGLYLAQGAAGLPVFAGGKSGLITLFGPTGGYLIGFTAAAYVVGILMELRYNKSLLYTGFSLLVGNLIIYTFGLFWLAKFVGESQALQLGLFPFLVGDLLKILLGVTILGSSQKIMSRYMSRG